MFVLYGFEKGIPFVRKVECLLNLHKNVWKYLFGKQFDKYHELLILKSVNK